MEGPFRGSEALATGAVTRHALRTRFVAIHKDVYVRKGTQPTALNRAKACWLRSRGHGVLAGFSAAAVHGAKWIDPNVPATVIDNNRRRTPGVLTWAAVLAEDEVCTVDGMRVTTPARTAIDLARRYPLDTAITAVDALARATRLSVEAIADAAVRYPGRHGVPRVREVLSFVDPGAESPQETWLRLVVVRAGYPKPRTQLPVLNEYGALVGTVDLGWIEHKIALEYEGKQHRLSAAQFAKDIRRYDEMIDLDWTVIRVTSLDSEATVRLRLADAWISRVRRVG
ncbi:type IV toxin-antitoxin system AbiEi family antitoxin [Mycobacterium sp. SMC-4]|uniref:type IV toxin-antitoxin system AbiEi family antitoxin n=1 Tax=Mycobacterium sp. SMC-4 TaxID=2857059 RepID=UPI0021B3D0E0|nr:type IV toxin-antitoxin system AbiEi family antitoxin [Mycobacterium sp. SMC-4]UXA18268.1 type IV toxin-antitoxin system AbiEi family antitoxin [Mycobacterium sp. SMC-4]